MAVAQNMVGNQPPAGSAPSPQTPPPPPVTRWHIAQNGQTLGPFTPEQMSQGIASGELRADTLVWSAGMANWTAAGQVPVLASLFQPAPPPPPPTREETS
jgi:hypothetical protein